jgi:hypothetical protein
MILTRSVLNWVLNYSSVMMPLAINSFAKAPVIASVRDASFAELRDDKEPLRVVRE